MDEKSRRDFSVRKRFGAKRQIFFPRENSRIVVFTESSCGLDFSLLRFFVSKTKKRSGVRGNAPDTKQPGKRILTLWSKPDFASPALRGEARRRGFLYPLSFILLPLSLSIPPPSTFPTIDYMPVKSYFWCWLLRLFSPLL